MQVNDKNITILQLIEKMEIPVGAIFISRELNMAQATAGKILLQLEHEGLIEKNGTKGRTITEKGKNYLHEQEQQNERNQTVNSIINMTSKYSKEKLLEIMEVRFILEDKTVELACANGNDEQRKKLEMAFLEHKLNVMEDGIGSEQDRKLHLTIAEMSGNKALYDIFSLVLNQDDVYTEFSARAENLKTIHVKQHEDITNAILARDAAKAKKVMRIHLEHVRDDFKKNFK